MPISNQLFVGNTADCVCRILRSTCCWLGVLALTLTSTVLADDQEAHFYNIPSLPLDAALIKFSRQTSIQLLMRGQTAAGLKAKRIYGVFSPKQALSRLLSDTDLQFEFSTSSTVIISYPKASDSELATQSRVLWSPSTATKIEEIIVTSQKREENLQSVPIAISVVSSDGFEDGLINSVESLSFKVPALNFRKGNNPRQSSLFLRGVGTISFSLANEASVSTVVDEVVLSQSGQAFSTLYDIERVEVLRGPQGTLFGKNASSGLVNIVTRGPTDTFESYLETAYFQEGEYKVKSSVSGPLNDNINARLTAYYGFYEGLFNNKFNGTTVNGYEDQGWRVQLAINPFSDLSILLTADYVDTDSDCCTQIIGSSMDNPTVNYLLENVHGVRFKGKSTRDIAQNFPAAQDQRNWGSSIKANWRIGENMLTSITAFRRWSVDQLFDQDLLPTVDFVGLRQLHNSAVSQFDQWSQEIRIASSSNDSFEYVLGGFLWAADNDRDFRRDARTCVASDLAEVSPGVRPCDESSSYLTGFAHGIGHAEIDNVSIFGQATYHVSDRFSIVTGARYSRDRVNFTFERFGLNSGVPGIPTNTPYQDAGSVDNDDLSFKLGFQYDIANNSSAYVTYAQGYKGPGFNVSFGMNPGFEGPIDPETSDSYEVGLKSDLLDGRLLLNLAVFYTGYDAFQSNSFVEVEGEQTVALTNAGTIIAKGVEADFQTMFTENLSLFGGLAYIDATVDQFNINPITNLPSAPNGSDLPFSPAFKLVIGAEYRLPFYEFPFDILINSHFTYSDEQFSALGEEEFQEIPSYALWNASLVFQSSDEKYRLAFVANNLLDEKFVSFSSEALEGRLYNVVRDADRYFGVLVNVKFP